MSFHHTRHVRKTQKTQECRWCWEPIQKGDPSVATSGIFEGDFCSGRYHPECHDVIPLYVRAYSDWCEPLPEDRMQRGGIEEYGYVPPVSAEVVGEAEEQDPQYTGAPVDCGCPPGSNY